LKIKKDIMKIGTVLLLLVLAPSMILAQGKKERDRLAYQQTKKLVESQNFIFEANRALPISGSSVSLITNDNFLLFKQGEVHAYLPYFGEGRVSAAYGGEGAIAFKGAPMDYQVRYNDNKNKITIRFDAMGKSEKHGVILDINAHGFTDLIIKSMNRTTISYYGKIKAYEGGRF
jgi:hypothetical protein